jgi:hypothetical protein
MMLLEDGFWRVRHFVKMKPEAFAKDTIKPRPIYTVKNNQILKNKIPIPSKESIITLKIQLGYFDLFNKDTIAADFDTIKKKTQYHSNLFNTMILKAKMIPEKMQKLKTF